MTHQWEPANIPRACERVTEVSDRMEREREAYQSFHNYLADQPVEMPAVNRGVDRLPSMQTEQTTSQMDEIRDVFNDTVMEVPHISAEKTFTECITGEFPQTVAEFLLTGDQLTPPLQAKLCEEAQESVAVRESFLAVLDREADQLESIERTLAEMGNTVIARQEEGDNGVRLEGDTAISREELLARCDELAEERQAALNAPQISDGRRFNMDSSRDFLYGSLPVEHPALADIAQLGAFVRQSLDA